MANHMVEDSPRRDIATAMRENIRKTIDAEIAHVLKELSTAEALSAQCQKALAAAYAHNDVEFALKALINAGKSNIEATCIPSFWNSVEGWEPEHHAVLVAALEGLVHHVQALYRKVSIAAEYLRAQSKEHPEKQQILLWAAPRFLFLDIGDLFEASKGDVECTEFFQSFYSSSITAMADSGLDGPALGTSQLVSGVRAATQALRSLGLRQMVDKVAAAAVKEHIKTRIEALLEENANQRVVQEVVSYTETVPLQFLELLGDQNSKDTLASARTMWQSEMAHYVYLTLGDLRISSLFDLVIDYSDSLPALEDLKDCLRHTDDYRKLVAIFGTAVRTRLLHPGAATADIIHHYVSTIRAMRHIDQSGTVLDLVSGPLREYLRTRKDAIRCIVTMITGDDAEGEGPGFLAELEAEGEGYDPDADFYGLDADKQALKDIQEELWEPPPFVIPGQPRRRRSTAPGDVVGMLVNIYGSRELFVSEYRSMLADRLLAKTDFDCDRELRTLELLKVRFGEQTLHAAEVMLRDLADSKRINANVRAMANNTTPLKAHNDLVPLDSFGVTIISELFWPQMANEEFTVPRGVQAMMRTFGHKYHALKAPRVLKWKPTVGTVSLTLTIGEKDIEFTVSPLHAALLIKFEEHAEWAPTDLAESLGVNADTLRRKIVYWINQGVILEVRGEGRASLLYRRSEELQRPAGGGADDGDSGMDVDGGEVPTVDPMSHYEPFVLGMLTNFDSLPLDRIHNMLKMFVTDPPYDRSIDQLSAFMGRLTTEDKVVLEGGVYKKARG